MKKKITILAVALLAVPLLVFALNSANQNQEKPSREDQWKKVEAAVGKGLPRTAIKHLKPIIKQAIQDKAYPDAIKAVTKKIALEGNIQGNKPEERIFRLEKVIKEVPKEMVPVLDAVLANWYWHYFQQNRWRFLKRTQTAGPPGNDIRTWDLPRILSEIDEKFAKALSAEKYLKNIPIETYDELLEKGTVPDSYRPTLYDFLAHNALAFYNSGTQAGAKSQDAFNLPADSPVFDTPEKFIAWKPKTTDTASPKIKAIRLYQKLLRFHQNDKDKIAFADADLHRLKFGYNQSYGENKKARYKAALERFTKTWANHQISARSRAYRAGVLQQEGELVEARKLALDGYKDFPKSAGGKLCYNLVQQIEAKSIQVRTERVWNDPWPTIRANYKNLTNVHLRAVPADYTKLLKTSRNYRPEYLSQAERKALLAKDPALEWSEKLPATTDYHFRVEKLKAPKSLQPGFYFLIASPDQTFGAANNQVSFSYFWVSKLAMVVRVRRGHHGISGFVLDAKTGEPVAGAQVQGWYRHNRNRTRVPVEPTKTDQNGLFNFPTFNNRGYLLVATYKDQVLGSGRDYSSYSYNRNYGHESTVFFTDRSLYRPGQTVQFQGIAYQYNQLTNNYGVIANRDLTVGFFDRNNKEVSRAKFRTNEYGSFSGSFNAPMGTVTGQMSIRVIGAPHGSTSFNVEEYKRPKFKVVLNKPEKAPKLNSPVEVTGKATAYTGAPVDGGKVRFRVVRQIRYPIWWRWCYWWRPQNNNSQEIANGFGTTEVDGTFKINFVALPDLSVSEQDEPTFHYQIYADVTDNTGETRSANTSVNVGYTALKSAMTADEWQTDDKEVKVDISTTTLDGVGQKADVVVKVYSLQQPDKVHRGKLSNYQPHHPFPTGRGGHNHKPQPDLSNPNSWELDKVVFEKGLTTDEKGQATLAVKLKAGPFRAMLETQDRFGKKVTAQLPLQVLDPDAGSLNTKIPSLVAAPEWSLQPGEEFSALWGTGYNKGRAFIEVEHRKKILQSYWTPANQTQVSIKQAVTEAMRGGFTLRVTMVRENRGYLNSRRISVPWTNKDLKVSWGRFVSKLEPGQKETWTAVITGPDAQKAVAEMVATLYDESLDAYLPHNWMQKFSVFRQEHSNLFSAFENNIQSLQHLHGNWPNNRKTVNWTYRSFPSSIIANLWGYGYFGGRGGFTENARMRNAQLQTARAPGEEADRANQLRDGQGSAKKRDQQSLGIPPTDGPGGQPKDGPNLDNVSARKNLDETAFFFPKLLSNKNGEVVMQFTMPEALTQWKFMGFVHDKELRSGFLQDSVVTSRDLMVQPNPPRFVREGDVLEFTVKVTNRSDKEQEGKVRLTFAEARTGNSVDVALGNTDSDKTFKVPAKESRSYAWRIDVPDGMGFLSYKAVGSSGKLMDGEEGYLPVLSRRIFVTESLPFWVRGPKTKIFNFKRLKNSNKSDTLEHKRLIVQAVSHPSWYAVMALPYLMEYPHECTEQTFNRLYANSLAHHIANSDPKIRKVFDQWKGTKALLSPMEKNDELRAVMLSETPWLAQAQNETQARKNVGILFDNNRLNNETARLVQRVSQLQRPDGAWPWFPGGPANDYITLYITTGFGRLRHLGVKVDTTAPVLALNRLDGWVNRVYRDIVRDGRKDKNNLTPTIALYLYGRSFFLQDRPIPQGSKEAVDYFLGQSREHWLKLNNRQSQGHLALALNRFDDVKTAKGIMRSIKERSVTDPELGRFWRDLELSWWWFQAPIETQAVMIEAFDEVMNDAEAVEECKVWLLNQKRTQDWKTTKATADAVYALLLRGPNPLVSDLLIEVTLGDQKIEPKNVEAGTGYYEKRFQPQEIKPEMGAITVKKTDEGLSWGSVNWQYMEDASKVTAYKGTPLKLKKELYTKVYTKKGPVLQPVQGGKLQVGDELVVRIELRVDRDMEYVHLKDQRGSGTEPVNVLSRYRYQDGLAYYTSTRDTASHFFIDYLPKGVYVFEYSTRVVHRGRYQTGMAEIQCMYAPEFNSHSQSFMLRVK